MNRLDKQKIYFSSQITKPIAFRKEALDKLEKGLKAYETKIYEAFKQDLSKPEMEVYTTEIAVVYRSIRDAKKNLGQWMKQQKVKTPFVLAGRKSFKLYEPLGNTLIIGPFNYPLQLVLVPLVGAIAAGNTAVIKTSELTPAISSVIHELISEFFIEDYIVVVEGDVSVNQELLKQPFDFIFFTGSTQVGKIVMKYAAENLTPVVLELGGKSPCVVTENANISLSAKRIAWGKFLNNGQTCVAPDYVLVSRKHEEALTQALIKEIKAMYGDDIKNNEDYGRIVNLKHADRLKQILEAHEDDIVFGGRSHGTYIEPTLLSLECDKGKVMESEIFGPILPIIAFDTLEEAYTIIEKNPKPLSLYVFTESYEEQEAILNRIQFGGGCINDTILHLVNDALPFGGIGNSGIGTYHGFSSFEVFSNCKSMMKSNSFPLSIMYPPYHQTKFKFIKKIFR
ncbi:aldehyde dehydrogenase family protein [Erysipelothrix rhusiopathiae]|uniref:aldehyde dehydrogenase family protein n=1 Tax=Erysipelothrix rhusiopathiae TaxID=1648 RepID=UPI002B23F191|nr:aldehyde dehydrogenase family protein [Erysipelothrix rhusiopathiae]WRB93267.1 aldehyde dehydrogenase family protein [Erysipelothrix rhusiopathiae]